MGGLIVQKYLERYDAPAGVLMTSIPPQGNLGNALRWIRQSPSDFAKMTITGKALPYINPPQLARERFFSPHTPEADVVGTPRDCKRTVRGSASTVYCCACPDPSV